MTSIAERLSIAASALANVTETPRLDAEILMAHALGLSRAKLLARLQDEAPIEAFELLLERRLAYEPIAYILGEWEFFGLPFASRRPVLVPRPETEHLVEVVLYAIEQKPAHVLEIGVGSGCISISIAMHAPNAVILATDIAAEALELARENAVRHKASQQIAFYQGDLFGAFPPDAGPFDVICSNPPYVEEEDWRTLSPVIRHYEDPQALLAGPKGLSVIESLIAESGDRLRPGGMLAFEIGMGQYSDVEQLLLQHGYQAVRFVRDLADIPRVAIGYKI